MRGAGHESLDGPVGHIPHPVPPHADWGRGAHREYWICILQEPEPGATAMLERRDFKPQESV